jgi:hypothetical protein
LDDFSLVLGRTPNDHLDRSGVCGRGEYAVEQCFELFSGPMHRVSMAVEGVVGKVPPLGW